MKFPQKLQGREMVNPHAIAKKVNEIIDLLMSAEKDNNQEEKNQDGIGNLQS